VPKPKPTREELIYPRLAALCASLPGTTEKISWGHPNFRAAGRTYAALESFKGEPSLAVRLSDEDRDLLLADPRFFATPYCGGRGWVSLRLAGRIPWSLVKQLCARAHALAHGPKKPRKRKRRD